MTTPTVARDDRARTLPADTQAYIRRTLVDDLDEHTRRLARHTAALDEWTVDDVDPETRLLANLACERAAEAVADIERALARLDAGTYGTCDSCGDTIAAARLEALPATRQCIACAARRVA